MHYEEKILNVHKPIGISPLDAIKALKEKYPKLKDEKMTYAGRLDPLAEGVLIILAGNEVYEKEKYLKMGKEYEAEIIFGFNTDTYDILGLPKKERPLPATSRLRLDGILKKLEGDTCLPLPPYSSYKIKGKPLFEWAREGKLNEIEIPERKTTIYEIKLLGLKNIFGEKLLQKIKQKINLTKGDFRQEKILANWQEILKKKMVHNSSDSINCVPFLTAIKLQIAKVSIKCSSGTYIRSIAHKLGQNLKTGAVLLGLKRTRVGDFEIKDSIDIECR